MTNQEAIEELKARKEHYEMGDGCEFLVEALEKGIKALEKQDTMARIKYDLYNIQDYTKEAKNLLRDNKIIAVFENLTAIQESLKEIYSKQKGE